MSNQPTSNPGQGDDPEVPINTPPSRPQAPSQPASGRPQPSGRPAPRPPQAAPAQPSEAAARAAQLGQQPSRSAQQQAAQSTQRQPVSPPLGVPPRTTGSHGRLPAAQQRQPIDLATRLDGQRGWLAQLERSLKKRSIIALILTCLAVGVGAAAIYISLTKNADSDRIDALQTRIEALEAAAGIPSTDTTVPEVGEPLPETGVTLPDETTVPSTGTTGVTDSSGVAIPPTGE
ncbi:MAG: hypothetical protein KDB57_08710 [Solirubrobacterales bacterium]|nr:hypothetical protein [Solirubrobacterales bacterium]